ncbi:ExbD/TolR family protein [Desulfomonile tiedjei]|uniref:Biopolymer transport protein n=1 Tax=Desulfomonile tiedjei (strain ATCC 49306 / DSM 6799 / DCB-1) TaxID=706587 RepID=I4C1K7_DESTA|nr:biopolymer transporter ExbD [Desulfomonile tiedjei]AFM23448.1 biopolymer transport protein [Desulfomonile tiedjei DSM 6799]
MWLSTKRKSKNSSLDITPLVDLVFLLIIFFLLSTTFNVSPGIRLDLPEASSQKIHKEKKEITVSVDQSGTIYMNKDPVDSQSLLSQLLTRAREDRDTTVLIKGDRSTAYGQMVDILGMVKQAGLHRIAILTQRKKDQPNSPDSAETR